ncbi:MAG: error-prone DNA polymerase [Anaeromyxobacter sp. RBG_16_69_14]|nr:MAG: error-prone DNA polymerase [Anaeromyxobacter sp. RBG_16_69_14]
MAPARYAELRCKSSFSFLRGASHPEELVARAVELELAGLALADVNGLYGVVRAHAEAKRRGLPLIVGAEIACVDLSPGPFRVSPLVLLAMDREGYAGLCRLLSEAHCGAPPAEDGAPARRQTVDLPFRKVAERARGLFALFPGVDGEAAARLRDAFGRRLALAVARHHVAGEETRIGAARSIGRRLGIRVAVTNDAHMHERRRQPLQDVLACIRLGTTVEKAGRRLFPNAERTLKGPEEMALLWPDFPEGLENAVAIADACRFRLDEIHGEHPLPPVLATPGDKPPPYTPADPLEEGVDFCAVTGMPLLRALVERGARWRWNGPTPEEVRRQIAKELDLVEHLDYASYFLTVWDVVRFARERGILCQGRGSAANSVLCYCLGITSIDPVRMGLLFERFISVERGEPPDIDVDFEHSRREEVIQYVYAKYGRDRAGMVCEVISYRGRSALRDVGKALGLSLAQVERLSRLLCAYEDLASVTPEILAQAGLDTAASPAVRQTLLLARELQGFPRHLSIHVGGFIITRRPLCETVPIEPAAMRGRTVVQWDKDDIAELGLLKVDLLGLGMLTALSRCLELLAAHHPGPTVPTAIPWPDSLATIPAEDPAVYEMVSRADTIGVFQIESRAQMSLLPRLKPRRFYDLVISVAIIRPGPIQGGMVHPFLRRRDGLEPVRYPYAPLAPVLEKTLGVPLFQEQAMRLAVVAAGFTPGEADELRRVMTHKRSHERMESMKSRLVAGMAERNIPRADAEEVFRQLLGFAGYGFPESHAASFALLVYASAWLKLHHPAAFACALLDSQPMGFYAPHTLVEDAKRHGVEVRGADVVRSDWESTLEGADPGRSLRQGERPALRVGLCVVRGLPRAVGEAVVAARRQRPFASIADLARRAALSPAWLERLASAGALRGLEDQRRRALWSALAVGASAVEGDLFAGVTTAEPAALIPEASASEEVAADYATTGLSERAHPMAMLRPRLDVRQVRTARELLRMRDRAAVEVAGLVIVRQRPETASGIVFVSLEDETGIANLVVMPDVYERFRPLVRGAAFLLAQGRVERMGQVVNVRVSSLAPLPTAHGIQPRARDFH